MSSQTEPVRWLATLITPLGSHIQRTSYGRDHDEAVAFLKAQYPDWDNYAIKELEKL